MVKERPARRRQLNSTRTTAEQFHANLVFEITDLPNKRRLRRMQAAFGRNGQATGLRDGHEVPQMSKLHTLPSISSCLAGMPASLQSLFTFRKTQLDYASGSDETATIYSSRQPGITLTPCLSSISENRHDQPFAPNRPDA